jgi:uncharacterized protein
VTAPLVLILVGFIVGTFGTLIGAGGGFILVPFLLFLYPNESPEVLTSISLAIVFLNSASGSVAYARNGRIDFRSGIIFALASVPGAVIGATVVGNVSREVFEPTFGVLMLIGGAYVFYKSINKNASPASEPLAGTKPRFNMKLGILISIGVGFIASFLGIGGGIIHVPTLIHLLNFPVHIATATSHFVLAITSLVATCIHIFHGTLLSYLDRVLLLGVPVIFGAQLGAHLSKKVHDTWVTRGLAIALFIVGIRLIV